MTSVVSEATLDDVPEGKCVLSILDASGDTKIIWDPNNADETSAAERTFKDLKKKRYVAYAVRADGEKAEVIQEFDRTAGKVILAPALAGG